MKQFIKEVANIIWKFMKYTLSICILFFMSLVVLGLVRSNADKDKEETKEKVEQKEKIKKEEKEEEQETQGEEERKINEKEWHKRYDGTKYNNKVIQIKNANTYSKSPVLNQSFKSTDGVKFDIKHIEISTQIKGLDGKIHKASKGNSFLIAACSVESTDGVATEITTKPYIEFFNKDDEFVKDKHISYKMSQEKWVNDSAQVEIVNGTIGSLPKDDVIDKVKNVNFIYEIATDNVRYMTFTDEKGSLDFYNDLNDASFELGEQGEEDNHGSNINASIQEQQE